jgi:hypothetical protein
MGILFVSNDGQQTWIKELQHDHKIFTSGHSVTADGSVVSIDNGMPSTSTFQYVQGKITTNPVGRSVTCVAPDPHGALGLPNISQKPPVSENI